MGSGVHGANSNIGARSSGFIIDEREYHYIGVSPPA
jgi:hypothetical protein